MTWEKGDRVWESVEEDGAMKGRHREPHNCPREAAWSACDFTRVASRQRRVEDAAWALVEMLDAQAPGAHWWDPERAALRTALSLDDPEL
jgi:hypothetical protein